MAVAAEPEVEVDWRLTSTWPETEPEMVYGEFGIGSLVIGGVSSAETGEANAETPKIINVIVKNLSGLECLSDDKIKKPSNAKCLCNAW